MTDNDVRVIDGEPYISTEMLGMLCGITPEEVRAEVARQHQATGRTDRFVIPKAWKRGAKEVQARYGTTDPAAIVARIRAEAGRRP